MRQNRPTVGWGSVQRRAMSVRTSLSEKKLSKRSSRASSAASRAVQRTAIPATAGRAFQAVHTVYGGAHLFHGRDRPASSASSRCRALDTYPHPTPASFGEALGIRRRSRRHRDDRASSRQAAPRGPRGGLPHRLRGRLRQPARRGRRRPRHRSGAAGRGRASSPARCRRSSGIRIKPLTARDLAAALAAHARRVP